MSRFRRGVVAAMLALLAPVAVSCTSHAKPQPKPSVFMNGDLARVPLSGSAINPLVWTQPATLDATQQAVALSERRFASLSLIMAGARPPGVQFDPLLAQLLTGSLATSYIPDLGDASTHVDQATPGRIWEWVVDVTIAGSSATLRSCNRENQKPTVYAATANLVLVQTDLGSSWRDAGGADLPTPADQKRCLAWARTLPAK